MGSGFLKGALRLIRSLGGLGFNTGFGFRWGLKCSCLKVRD